ncbi:MAG: gamma-glutamyltransferase [Alphaproteobacteria bacterium]|nr:gamma-glutamyltransferase [Alphaproteobacteria bacterium]
MVFVLLLAGLAACESGPQSALAPVEGSQAFAGAIAADEPRAAIAGRDILTAGGSAADAAAAMFLTLTATYPQAAGLGGGGMCMVYSPRTNKAEALDFLPRLPRGGGELALPGNLRGFGALQARHGKLRWSAVVTPAETLALFGWRATRATVRALGDLDPDDLGKPAAIAYMDGINVVPEGAEIKRPDLGLLLGRIRMEGPNLLNSGALAQSLVEAASEQGGQFLAEDLRSIAPAWSDATALQVDSTSIAIAPGPAGEAFRRIWEGSVTPGLRLIGSASHDRGRLATAMAGAHGNLSGAEPLASAASTSFAAMDADGQAVACAVTMQQPFGNGRGLADGAIQFAPRPGPEGAAGARLVATVAFNTVNKLGFAAGAATGGLTAAAALAQTSALALVTGRPVTEALAASRIFRASSGAVLQAEAGAEAELTRGENVAEVSRLGLVNLIYCPGSAQRGPQTCRAAADPRGFGLAQIAGR